MSVITCNTIRLAHRLFYFVLVVFGLMSVVKTWMFVDIFVKFGGAYR